MERGREGGVPSLLPALSLPLPISRKPWTARKINREDHCQRHFLRGADPGRILKESLENIL